MTLNVSQVRSFYDRFGSRQDAQGFYEQPALTELIAHGHFAEAEKVFEFGCGTGRFAAHLLAQHLPASADYLGIDLSQTMVNLATARLAGYGDRARVRQTGGSMTFPLPDRSSDRVVATYVLDLLPEGEIKKFIDESHRVLTDGGRLCLVSLTEGTTLGSRFVSRLWTTIFRWRPFLVGGCRPLRLEPYLAADNWDLEYRRVVIAYGVPSEVLVARAGKPPRRR